MPYIEGETIRDIMPENILLHDGRAMVMDFGIDGSVDALGTSDVLRGEPLLPGFARPLRELFTPD